MMRAMGRTNRLYLARHGQVVGHERFPIYGHTDVDVTEEGKSQMEALADRLRQTEIAAVYASDLQRSEMGARTIARHHDVEVHVLPELREMYFGDWEAMTVTDVQERFPDELRMRGEDLVGYEIPGGGESIEGFSRRVLTRLEDILREREGKDILIVAHGGVNRVILCAALGLDLSRMFTLHQDYGCLNIVDYFPDTALVRLVNG
jgi:alpha-ribazole phosphatase/probable phosphoglycerate mutase